MTNHNTSAATYVNTNLDKDFDNSKNVFIVDSTLKIFGSYREFYEHLPAQVIVPVVSAVNGKSTCDTTTMTKPDRVSKTVSTVPTSPTKRRPPTAINNTSTMKKAPSMPPSLTEYLGGVDKKTVEMSCHTPSTIASTMGSSITSSTLSFAMDTLASPNQLSSSFSRCSTPSSMIPLTQSIFQVSSSSSMYSEVPVPPVHALTADQQTVSDINTGDEEPNRIKVAVRLKPLSTTAVRVWDVCNDGVCYLQQRSTTKCNKAGSPQGLQYAFDSLYDENSSTRDIYESLGKPVVESVATGATLYGTVFAYGATGSGKTYTMQGDECNPGLIHLAAENLFALLEQQQPAEAYSVRVQYIEIYNEQVRDLLDENRTLVVQEDVSGNVVFDAAEEPVDSAEDVSAMLTKGNINRACASTHLNSHSSRSHAIFRIVIQKASSSKSSASSVLTLVDLAGSENSSRAISSGTRKQEGGMINQSLLTLSQVIHALSLPEHKRPKHISFRSSKLTRLLKPQLTGKSSISLLTCVSAAHSKLDETKSSLKFATTAKKIVVKPTSPQANLPCVNETVVPSLMVNDLKKELAETKETLKALQERFNESFQMYVPPEVSTTVESTTCDDTSLAHHDDSDNADASSEAVIGDGVENPDEYVLSHQSNRSVSSSDSDTPPVSVVLIRSNAPLANPFEDEAVKARLEEAEVKIKFLQEQLAASDAITDALFCSVRDLKVKQQEQQQQQHRMVDDERRFLIADIPTIEDVYFVVEQSQVLMFLCITSICFLFNGMVEPFVGVIVFLWVSLEITKNNN